MLRTLAPSILRPILRSKVPAPAPAFYGDFGTGQSGGFALTRATTATYFDAAGVIQTAGINTQRLDYDPATGRLLGSLREPARVNRALSSRDISTAHYYKGDVTTPDAITVAENGATAGHQLRNSLTLTAATQYTASWIVKGLGRTWVQLLVDPGDATNYRWANVNLSTGETGDKDAGTVVRTRYMGQTLGWRISLTFTTPGVVTNPYFGLYCIAAGDDVLAPVLAGIDAAAYEVRECQVENGHCMTSPIPTTDSTVTRAVDNFLLSGTAFANIWNAAEGTILVEFSMPTAPPASSFPVILSANDTTANERVSMMIIETSGALNFGLTDGGVVQATCSIAGAAVYDGTPMRLAAGWRLNDVRAASAAGTLATQDTSATIPTVTQMQLAEQAGGATPVTPMHFRRVAYWPLRLPDQALVSLATTG